MKMHRSSDIYYANAPRPRADAKINRRAMDGILRRKRNFFGETVFFISFLNGFRQK